MNSQTTKPVRVATVTVTDTGYTLTYENCPTSSMEFYATLVIDIEGNAYRDACIAGHGRYYAPTERYDGPITYGQILRTSTVNHQRLSFAGPVVWASNRGPWDRTPTPVRDDQERETLREFIEFIECTPAATAAARNAMSLAEHSYQQAIILEELLQHIHVPANLSREYSFNTVHLAVSDLASREDRLA